MGADKYHSYVFGKQIIKYMLSSPERLRVMSF